jgi:hypothetical protein
MKISNNSFKAIGTVLASVAASGGDLYGMREDILLWIDALCINQNNISEKNVQMPLTGEIYWKTKTVAAYIGTLRDGDRYKGVEAIALAAGANAVNLSTVEVSSPNPIQGNPFWELWSQPWFGRVWVTQEVVLNRAIVCLYGDETRPASWHLDTMERLMLQTEISSAFPLNDTETSLLLRPRRQLLATDEDGSWTSKKHMMIFGNWWKLRQIYQSARSGIPLLLALEETRELSASDQRDKVYALLSMLTEEDRWAIRVDYSTSNLFEKVCREIAEYCVNTGQVIRLFENVGTSRNIPTLPTRTGVFRQGNGFRQTYTIALNQPQQMLY